MDANEQYHKRRGKLRSDKLHRDHAAIEEFILKAFNDVVLSHTRASLRSIRGEVERAGYVVGYGTAKIYAILRSLITKGFIFKSKEEKTTLFIPDMTKITAWLKPKAIAARLPKKDKVAPTIPVQDAIAELFFTRRVTMATPPREVAKLLKAAGYDLGPYSRSIHALLASMRAVGGIPSPAATRVRPIPTESVQDAVLGLFKNGHVAPGCTHVAISELLKAAGHDLGPRCYNIHAILFEMRKAGLLESEGRVGEYNYYLAKPAGMG